MKYQHKTLHFFITRKEFRTLTKEQRLDYINLHKQEKEDITYQRFFRHFAMRLMERCDIAITYEEYVDLCKLPYIQKPELITNSDSSSVIKGIINIKDKKILVYKLPHGLKQLLTALKTID